MDEAKLDVSEVFEFMELLSYNMTDEITESQIDWFSLPNMTKMMRETRPTYPSSKLTFSIANLAKHKAIRFFNLGLILNEQFDIDVVLEDSKRNFLNSLIIFSFP